MTDMQLVPEDVEVEWVVERGDKSVQVVQEELVWWGVSNRNPRHLSWQFAEVSRLHAPVWWGIMPHSSRCPAAQARYWIA